jgi:hypothetical protein
MPTEKKRKKNTSREPIVIDAKVPAYSRLFPREVELTEEEVMVIIEILSIFDNRHDFKPGSRNQSLTLNEVLVLLSEKSELIHKIIITSKSNKKELLQELLNIHCKAAVAKYTRNTCETIDNPDYRVEDYMINTVFQEPIVIERKSHLGDGNKYKDYKISNMQKLKFSSKESLEAACGLGTDRNPLLESLLNKIGTLTGTDSKNIRFCIDVSSIGEWVFHHNAARIEDTHLKTIADDYDCFRINPDRQSLVQSFTLKQNHVVLTDFTVKSDTIQWRSPNREGELSLKRTTRAGVAIMAEAIRIVIDSKKSKSKTARSEIAAPELINKIFGLPYNIPSIEYGKHIMDFKRLMDTTKLSLTLLYNRMSPYKVVLVTHDKMLYLLAKTLQCPVIFTIKNVDHTRELLFDIPSNLTLEQQAQTKADRIAQEKKEKEERAKIQAYWDSISSTILKPPEIKENIAFEPGTEAYKLETIKNNFYRNIEDIVKDIQTEIKLYYTKAIIPVTKATLDELLQNIKEYNLIVQTIAEYRTLEERPIIVDPTVRAATVKLVKFKKQLFLDTLTKLLPNLTIPTTGYFAVKNTIGAINRTYKTQGGSATHNLINHSALDLLIKSIRKFISRYESQTITEQEKYYLPQEQTPGYSTITRPMLEALMRKFVEKDKPRRGVTQEPAKVKITRERAVSAPAALVPTKKTSKEPMQVDTQILATKKRRASKSPTQLLAEP